MLTVTTGLPNSIVTIASQSALCHRCAHNAGVAGGFSLDGKTLTLPSNAVQADIDRANGFVAAPPVCACPPLPDPTRVQLTAAYLNALQALNQVPPQPGSGPDVWATTRTRLTAQCDAAITALNDAGGPV